MWKTEEGSSARLLQLCAGYFLFYVATGLIVKAFTAPAAPGAPARMGDLAFLAYNTFGANLTCLIPVLLLGWWRMPSARPWRIGGMEIPSELAVIIPSGICTAIIIPATTLLYTLPISVMVAMVIMRACVIVLGRLVDSVLIAQGVLRRKVYWEENAAVVFAVLAAGLELLGKGGNFDFLSNRAAVIILSGYLAAYALRLYIMNWFKNTRPAGMTDNRGFFALEQISASLTMGLVATLVILAPGRFSWGTVQQVAEFSAAFHTPAPNWAWAAASGAAFGAVAFFSVFIFMFKGRTATFTGLVNRLTSLVAGTAATLVGHFIFGSKFPSLQNWMSLGLVLVSVAFLTLAEKKRARELAKEQ